MDLNSKFHDVWTCPYIYVYYLFVFQLRGHLVNWDQMMEIKEELEIIFSSESTKAKLSLVKVTKGMIDLKPNICNMLHLTRRPTWAVSSRRAVTTSKLLIGSTMTKAPMATIPSQVLRMLVWLALCTRASTVKGGPKHLTT